MVTAKQRAWRKKFAARYGKRKKRKGASTRRVRRIKNRRPYKMARRRYGRRRKGRGKSSVALMPLMPVLYQGWASYNDAGGLNTTTINAFVARTTGLDMAGKTFSVDRAKYFWLGEGVAIIAHKVANRSGINRTIRKMTGGYLSL